MDSIMFSAEVLRIASANQGAIIDKLLKDAWSSSREVAEFKKSVKHSTWARSKALPRSMTPSETSASKSVEFLANMRLIGADSGISDVNRIVLARWFAGQQRL